MRKPGFVQWIAVTGLLSVAANGTAQIIPLDSLPFWQSAESGIYSTGMVWRDCNNDDYIDVFFSNGNDIVRAANTIYLSEFGNLPTPGASWSSTNFEYSGHCAVGDIDDDGFPDFAVANYLGPGGFGDPGRSNLYLNDDGFPSRSPDWYSQEFYSFSCALGDADGDGDLDLAFATGEGYTSQQERDVIYYNINGVLQTTPGWQSSVATAALDVAWGDVNNDGYLDLAFCYDDFPVAVYYSNAGLLETSPSWQCNYSEPANTIIFGDVNVDGWLDLIVAYNDQLGGSGRYRVYYNDGAGNLDPEYGWQSVDGGFGSALALYDFDWDGDDDLAAGRWWDYPRLYLNTGDSFTSFVVWQAGLSTVAEELAWVDVDGDGVEIRADTVYPWDGRTLFYISRHPLYSLDSVFVDGGRLAFDDYCFDPFYGWISLVDAPLSELIIYYQYSFKNDLAVSNWDTVNYVYGNMAAPFVRPYADTGYGWAPLTVHFTDSSFGASSWFWRFGDGDSSSIANPVHTYTGGGAYDVYLEVTAPHGWHNRTVRNMIVLLADTLYMPDSAIVYEYGQPIKIPLHLRNTQPLFHFVLPLRWDWSLDIDFDSLGTESCRSDYFERVALVVFDPASHKIVADLVPNAGNGAPPLEPGYGPILNLCFTNTAGSGTVSFDTASHMAYSLVIDSRYVVYQPYVLSGSVTLAQCGDVNGSGSGPFVDDLTYLVDYLFHYGPPPPVMGAADVDGYPGVNVADITYIVAYLFQGGPFPDCP